MIAILLVVGACPLMCGFIHMGSGSFSLFICMLRVMHHDPHTGDLTLTIISGVPSKPDGLANYRRQ